MPYLPVEFPLAFMIGSYELSSSKNVKDANVPVWKHLGLLFEKTRLCTGITETRIPNCFVEFLLLLLFLNNHCVKLMC